MAFGTTTISLIVVLAFAAVAYGQVTLPLTATGTGGVTIPAGYEWANVTVQCWGGGGGGGGNYGAGGGGGAYSANTYSTPLVAGTYSYYVGAGGSGGYSGGGGEGGNTIWNYGGVQDIIAGGGMGSARGTVVAGTGYPGGAGGSDPNGAGGGGGGGSGGPDGPGGNGGSNEYGGIGGAGYGPGGNGGYENGGNNGTFPGGGGGGAFEGYTGGRGANSEIIITYTPEALAIISLNAQNASIITGGTSTLGATIGNSVSANLNLNYTLSAAVLSGSAALGQVNPSSGTVAPGSSQPCTVSAASTTFGLNTISFTASDPNSSNLSQTTTATLTVLDHSNASLSPATTQTTQTINFGNVLKGSTVPSQTFTIYNLAANTSAQYTANLALSGFTPSSNAAFQTNLATFNGLTAIKGSNGNIFSISLNTSSNMSGSGTISMSASQLIDDSSLPGAGSNNYGGLTIALEGNVGKLRQMPAIVALPLALP